MCQPYIESTTVLSDIYMDTTVDHFTPLALRVRGNNFHVWENGNKSSNVNQ